MTLKSNLKKSFKILLIALLALVTLFSLFACNKNKKPPQDQQTLRAATVESFISTALTLRNSGWSGDLTNDQIALLASPGDYVVEYQWLSLVGDVLMDSSLQNAKITALADSLKTDEGKAYLSAASATSSSDYVSLLSAYVLKTGLTSDDAAALSYDFAYAFVKDSKSVFDICIDNLNALKLKSLSASAIANVDKRLQEVTSSRSDLLSYVSGDVQDELLSKLSAAKEGIQSVAAFAYTTALTFADGNVTSVIGGASSGSLNNLTPNDIVNFFTSMKSGIQNLQTSLTGGDGAKMSVLSDAIKSVSSAFASVPMYNSTAQSLFSTLKYASAFVDYLPTLLGVTLSVWDVLDVSFATDVKAVIAGFADEEQKSLAQNVNMPLLISRLFNALTANMGEDELSTLVDDMCTSISATPSGGASLFYAETILNGRGSEQSVLDEATITAMSGVSIQYIEYNNLVKNYYQYASGSGSVTQKTVQSFALNLLKNYLGKTDDEAKAIAFSTVNYTWFKTVTDMVDAKFAADITKYMPTIKADLKHYVSELYSSSTLDALASKPLATDATPQSELDSISSSVQSVGLLYLTQMLMVLVA